MAIAPGKVCVYERNVVTNDELYKAGIELCVVPSEELSRGRGGPRCMSMPFARRRYLARADEAGAQSGDRCAGAAPSVPPTISAYRRSTIRLSLLKNLKG